MELSRYVESIRRDLTVAAEVAGAEAMGVAERLLAAVDSAVRLALLDALATAADEITRELAPGAVEVRLRGREPEFVVTPPPATEPDPEARILTAEIDDDLTARISLRLPESLKSRVEEAAARDHASVNSWLVRSVASVVTDRSGPKGGRQFGQHRTGWVR